MTFKLRNLLPTVFLAAAAYTAVAHADTFTGTVYNDAANGGSVVDPSTLSYLRAADTTHSGAINSGFTISSFNFYGNTPPPTGFQSYQVGGFLAGGNALSFDNSDNALAGFSMANTEFVFSGNTALVNGATYTFTHDDGMVLYVDGVKVIDSAGPTAAQASPFTFTGTSGVHGFVLEYGENGAPPAELVGPFTPAAVTPEPSSILLLGSGLLGLAGAVRRRFQA